MKGRISGIIRLMRPQSVILMLLFVYLPLVTRGKDCLYGLMQIFPLYFLLTGEIILNDYVDIDKDTINKKHRPLAAGDVSVTFAKKLIGVFLGIAIVSSVVIYKNHPMRLVLFYSVFIMLTIYSVFIRQLAYVKTFLTGLATVLCLSFVFTYVGYDGRISKFLAVAFFYIVSRELLMDIRDYEGDKKYGCYTLAIYLGCRKCYCLAVTFLIISQLIYLHLLIIENNLIISVLWLLAIGILLPSVWQFQNAERKVQNKIIIILWIPMVLSTVSIIL